jgi:hypothetical protein
MMMIVAARRDVTNCIQPPVRPCVNVNSVQNLCASGGRTRNFWGFRGKSEDNPVTCKIPLDLHRCRGASYLSTGKRTPTGTRGKVPNTGAASNGGFRIGGQPGSRGESGFGRGMIHSATRLSGREVGLGRNEPGNRVATNWSREGSEPGNRGSGTSSWIGRNRATGDGRVSGR